MEGEGSCLRAAGVVQHAKAQQALAAICSHQAEHHAITLSNFSKGKLRHTLYEFWPARVRAILSVAPSSCCQASHLLHLAAHLHCDGVSNIRSMIPAKASL